MIITVDIDANA